MPKNGEVISDWYCSSVAEKRCPGNVRFMVLAVLHAFAEVWCVQSSVEGPGFVQQY